MGFFTGAAGGIVGGVANFLGQSAANEANAKEAANSRNLQYHMSNTAHQREVNDLRKAGLNPILSATGGSGASTASGAQAKIENALGPSVSTALDSIRLNNEVQALKGDLGLKAAQANAAQAGAMRDASTAKQNEMATKVLETQFPAIQAESKTKKGQAEHDLWYQNYDNLSKRIQQGLDIGNSGASIVDKLKPFPGKIPKGSTLIKNKTGEILRERN